MEAPGVTNNSEDEILEAFKIFDNQGNGKLAASELKAVLKNLGEPMSDEDVDALLDAADQEAGGYINYEEFLKKMLSA